MSETPYQKNGSSSSANKDNDEAPLCDLRRRKNLSPEKNLSMPLPISPPPAKEHDNHSVYPSTSSDGGDGGNFIENPVTHGHMDAPLEIDSHGDHERRASIRETICNAIFGKFKVLVLGQVLSLLLAGTGAIQSSLYLDCHLSAPTFSMLSFYLPVCIVCLSRLFMEERRRSFCSSRERLSSDDNDGPSSPTGGSTTSNEDIGCNDLHLTDENSTETSDRFYMECSTNDQTCGDAENCPCSSTVVKCGKKIGVGKSPDKKEYSLLGLISLQSSPALYAGVAFTDLYANYTTILAFKYTTITSVSLFDALAIPSAIFVSRVFFGRTYTKVHMFGVFMCCVGITCNILEDFREDKELSKGGNGNKQEELIEEDYPHKTWGDALAITGGILFGISNTLGEIGVRNWGSRTEYLGCMTFFASIISIIQALVLEREEIMSFFGRDGNESCSESEGLVLLSLFAVFNSFNYVGISAFLQVSEAAFLNLSLLTGDMWAVIFSVFAEKIIPPPTFYVALAFTLSGVFIYETAPCPVSEEAQKEIFEGDSAVLS